MSVRESGLVIDPGHPFLAGSPDGVVYVEDGER